MSLISLSLLSSPLLLAPDNFTNQLWGGHWIPALKGLRGVQGPIGESWEFSARPERPTRVSMSDGSLPTLPELIKKFPAEILGNRLVKAGVSSAPILIKLLDAQDNLSVQVHPSDEQVSCDEINMGKSEAWVILDIGPDDLDGYIYLGFDPEKAAGYSTKDEFESAFFEALNQANGMGPTLSPSVRAKAERLVLPFLNKIKVRPGEVYEVPPGAIHCVGRGVRLYEIQQSSDLTYRLWDWNRPDTQLSKKEGRPVFRELHLPKAHEALIFDAIPLEYFRSAPVPCVGPEKIKNELLITEHSKKFAVNKILFEEAGPELTIETDNQFQVLTVLKGELEAGGKVSQGHSVLIPACLKSVSIKANVANTEVLRGYIPI